MFKSRSKSQDSSDAVVVTDYVHSDPEALMQESGLVARWLVTGLDKAAKLQHKTIVKYVDRLKEKNPQATPAEIQAKLDKHFLLTITSTGAGRGCDGGDSGGGVCDGGCRSWGGVVGVFGCGNVLCGCLRVFAGGGYQQPGAS